MVSTMNMKACSGITRMWKHAHTTPNSSWPKAPRDAGGRVDGKAAAEHGEQQEDHFAGVEISVEAQAQRHGARQVLDEVQQQVERHHPLAERVREQLPGEAAEAFDLEAVEHDDQEYRDRHAEGDVEVGGRHHLEVLETDLLADQRQQIHRHVVHEVEQQDPAEDGQRERRDQLAVAMEGVAHLGVDELDHDFDEVLELAGYARRGLAGRHIEGDHEHQAEQHREEDAVEVEGPETLADLQVLQVMNDVFVRRLLGGVFGC